MNRDPRTMQAADAAAASRAPENTPTMVKKIGKTTYKVHVHRDSAVVLNLQQQISDEMEQERPSEERIVALLCEIAGQLYKETNAKTQIAAQIARKRVSLMKPQDAFNAAYFSELIDAVSLHVGGGVVLHTHSELLGMNSLGKASFRQAASVNSVHSIL